MSDTPSVFVGDDAIDHIFHGPRLLIRRLGCRFRGDGSQPAQDQAQDGYSKLAHVLSPLQ
jgi:hypothetical protein